MSAWSNWVGKFCFIAALAVPIPCQALHCLCRLRISRTNNSHSSNPLPSKSSHNWSRRLRFIPMLCWRRY